MPPFLIPLLPSLVSMVAGAFGIDTTTDSTKLQLAQINLQAQQLVAAEMTAQTSVNAAEAAAPNRTWRTWREQLGLICVWVVATYYFIGIFLVPLLPMIGQKITAPTMDVAPLIGILMTMLGAHFVDSKYNSAPGETPTN